MHLRCLALCAVLSLSVALPSFADPPLPRAPKKPPATLTSTTPVKAPMPAVTSVSALAKASLNPQPLPPKDWGMKSNPPGLNPGVASSLNPQPLPPKVVSSTGNAVLPGSPQRSVNSKAPGADAKAAQLAVPAK